MRIGIVLAIGLFLTSCDSGDSDSKVKVPNSKVVHEDSPVLWSAEWEAQKKRLGGEPVQPGKMQHSGRRVFIIKASRFVDTKIRFYSIRESADYYDNNWQDFAHLEGALEYLCGLKDAAVYYSLPDT